MPPNPHSKRVALIALILVAPAPADAADFAAPWIHAAPHSAVIYWRMKDLALEATSCVEYGPTSSYGRTTATAAEPRWAHLHRLDGLKPAMTYHYRMVMLHDGKRTVSADATLTTPASGGATPVPGKLPGPPYVLDKPGKYLLTKDISAPGTAVRIDAGGVELDLDGHTVTFGTAKGKQAAGIALRGAGAVAVRNGLIVQGEHSADYSAAVESRWRMHPREIAGITAKVHRPNGYPIKLLGSSAGAKVHHNLLVSGVTEIESRHYPGNDLLRVDLGKEPDSPPCLVHDNILTGGCHRGLAVNGAVGGSKVHHNDIRHHAMYVNGYAVSLHAPGIECFGNRITSTGRGMHLTRPDLHVHDNRLDIKGHATLDDMPAKSRPFKKIMVELHGIKFEGTKVVRAKVHGNFVRIRQPLEEGSVRYVPATPLNVAGYDPAAMNEVYDNTIIALTHYRKARFGGYGNSGQWAAAIYFVGMDRGAAPEGKYSIHIHDNRFFTNHLFAASGRRVNQTIRVEKNTFTLVEDPPPVPAESRFRRIGQLEQAVRAGRNTFK